MQGLRVCAVQECLGGTRGHDSHEWLPARWQGAQGWHRDQRHAARGVGPHVGLLGHRQYLRRRRLGQPRRRPGAARPRPVHGPLAGPRRPTRAHAKAPRLRRRAARRRARGHAAPALIRWRPPWWALGHGRPAVDGHRAPRHVQPIPGELAKRPRVLQRHRGGRRAGMQKVRLRREGLARPAEHPRRRVGPLRRRHIRDELPARLGQALVRRAADHR
mmetsp:Transcript_25836/g.51791  ORF Transcript_25836/g.51791 Transcript_25836/m.51791 type:complete len:217 (-) Transcript_25836:92-742(-)